MRPTFHRCIWGRGRGREAGTPYLLLEPGAMAPSRQNPETKAADAFNLQPRCAPGFRPLKMAVNLNLAPE